ncbi:hypothetical protein [Daejeonella sp. H1SJ63]|uniref:hypothetical protein n=1 Tax=Daejeonella sp. H1SJ63 TaxID=3034145 RepID=UPI0023ED6693|nr:hypothetical protein [Daejeonella sp. H1SJ63]
MKISTLLCWMLVIATIISCRKDKGIPVPTVFETIISGKVYEGNSMQGIKGSKIIAVKIEGADKKRLDSVYTDDQGKFKLILKTPDTLKADYRWTFEIDKKYYYFTSYENIKLGKANSKDIPVYETGILKARIIYKNLPNAPLRVSTGLAGGSLKEYVSHSLTKSSGDTILLLRFIPNRKHDVSFKFPLFSGAKNKYYELEPMSSRDTITRSYNLDFDNFWMSPWPFK